MADLVILGGGASGLMAAVSAARVRTPAPTSGLLLFCRKATIQPGNHPEENMNAVAKDSPNPWNALASQNPVVHFIDVCLRGAGQVMFQEPPERTSIWDCTAITASS